MKKWTAPFFWVLLFLTACGTAAETSLPPLFIEAPQVSGPPNPTTMLVRQVVIKTKKPSKISLLLQDGETQAQWIDSNPSTDHNLELFGLKPGKNYSAKIIATFADGFVETYSDPEFITTDPLPDNFPLMEVLQSKPELMEPGLTLFEIAGLGNRSGESFILMVDAGGEILWLNHRDLNVEDLRMLENGNLLFTEERDKLVEMDLLGNEIRRWHAALSTDVPNSIPVATLAFHHEVFPLENGNFFTLSVETREYPDYPSSDTDPMVTPEAKTVVGDLVLEVAPTGEIVQQYSMLDLLDPHRIGYGSLGSFWNSHFPGISEGTADWSHGNAVIYDARDDAIIVSLRHQDSALKFRRGTGELVWILGPHENWDPVEFGAYLLNPVGAFEWQFHQHAPELTPEGNILLFDNGDFKALPFDTQVHAQDNFSRVVEYAIDETTMQVRQVWQYKPDPILYASFVGDADSQPTTGNVLSTFGGILRDSAGNFSDSGGGSVESRLIEVTHEDNPQVVFDLFIHEKDPNYVGWIVYRSERVDLGDLFPTWTPY